jgi:hypothetical protein
VCWGVRQPRAGNCAKQQRKMPATSNVFKIERCGSSLLTSDRKTEFVKKMMISKQNRKQKVL